MGREDIGVVVPLDEEESSGGGSLTKKTPGLRSWILMEASGQEMNLEVDKYTIMRRVQIHARDFRILDPLLSYPSKILCRQSAIVLNLEHIKAIITAEEVLLLNSLDDNVIPVVEELRRRLQLVNDGGEDAADDRDSFPQEDVETAEENPFEFTALDVVLEAICSYLDARCTELENAGYPTLEMLTSKISHRNLDKLRKLKSQMARLNVRVQKVRNELHQLLEHDHDMAALYLSSKLINVSAGMGGSGTANRAIPYTTASKTSRASRGSLAADHVGALEMLLEAYFIQTDDTLKRLATLRGYIDNTEAYLKIQLDNRRNQLYQLDLFLTAGVLSLSLYAGFTGFFGMNFNFLWSSDGYGYTFKWVVIVSGIISALFFIFTIYYGRSKGHFRFQFG